MTHVVLIPGAGGAGWYWHRVVEMLQIVGESAVAIDLPADDPSAGLPRYTELVLAAVGDASDVLIVGQSLGGFTAPLVARALVERGQVPAGLMFLNAMIPAPGETPGAWWGNVDSESARIAAAEAGGWSTDFDLETYFLHDVDPVVAAAGEQYQSDEADAVFGSVCDLEEWPDVPTRVIAGAEDRFFPLALQQRVSRDRLGLDPVVIPGGHLAALSRPEFVVAAILDRRLAG